MEWQMLARCSRKESPSSRSTLTNCLIVSRVDSTCWTSLICNKSHTASFRTIRCSRCSKATYSRSFGSRRSFVGVFHGKLSKSASKCVTCTGCMQGTSPETSCLRRSARPTLWSSRAAKCLQIVSTLTRMGRCMWAPGLGASATGRVAWTGAMELAILEHGNWAMQVVMAYSSIVLVTNTSATSRCPWLMVREPIPIPWEQSTKASGVMICSMVTAQRSGPTPTQSSRGNSSMVYATAMVHGFTRTSPTEATGRIT